MYGNKRYLMKHLISLVSIYSLLLPITFAQLSHNKCGTTISSSSYSLLQKQILEPDYLSTKLQGAICTLTVKPHIVRRTNGTGGLTISDLNTSIAQLNQAYLQVGFHFTMSTPNYINNDTYFNQLLAASVNEFNMANPNIDSDYVNVFYAPNAGFLSGGQLFPANWTSLPQNTANRNWIIMNNGFAIDSETLPHEVGHYFNLLHTHDEGIAKEHVTRVTSDNCYNANTAGDLVIDTPADHDLATWPAYGTPYINIDAGCNYIANKYDSCDPTLPYTPDTRNVMSYAYIDAVSIGCRIDFSQGQIDRMVHALDNLRPELTRSCSSVQCNIIASPTTVFATANGGNEVTNISTPNLGDTWNVNSDTWITQYPQSGTGTGPLNFYVTPNTGPARTGTIVISCGGVWPGPGPAPSASVTVVQEAASVCPDLSPILNLLPNNIFGLSNINVVAEIAEVKGADTDGTAIRVRIPSDQRLLFSYDPTLTNIGFNPVNNSDWTYVGDNGFIHEFSYIPSVLSANGRTAFGFIGLYDPQSTVGQTTLTATIVPLSGGECEFTNNTDAETLIYFD